MSKLLKAALVLLLGVITAFVQLVVFASAFRVTSNDEWYPVQLVAFAFDGLFILAVLRFFRRKPTFSAGALFILAGDVALCFLALFARGAPERFPGAFDQ